MDQWDRSRLRSDYDRLLDNTFWVAFMEEIKKKMDQAEREPVHGPLDSPEGVAFRTALSTGKFEAFRSVLGLPDVILDAPSTKRS